MKLFSRPCGFYCFPRVNRNSAVLMLIAANFPQSLKEQQQRAGKFFNL